MVPSAENGHFSASGAGCIAGTQKGGPEYRAKLAAGFETVDVEPNTIYGAADARQLLAGPNWNWRLWTHGWTAKS